MDNQRQKFKIKVESWKDIGLVIGGAAAAVVAAPFAIASLGFTSAGIAANSTAAAMMSLLGNGSWSVIPALQSAGATGVMSSAPLTGVFTCIGGVIGYAGPAITRAITQTITQLRIILLAVILRVQLLISFPPEPLKPVPVAPPPSSFTRLKRKMFVDQ